MTGAVSRRFWMLGAAGTLAAPSLRAEETAAAPEDADAVPDDSEFVPTLGTPSIPVPRAERYIWAINNANEEVATAYRAGEAENVAAMGRLQMLFRDIRENAPGPLPPMLVDMLSLLQERYGYRRPIRVISGYRTLRTNLGLEHAAPNSFHLHGYAADFYIPTIPVLDVAIAALELSTRFGFMGVGFYRQFVHVDVGPRRSWTNFDA